MIGMVLKIRVKHTSNIHCSLLQNYTSIPSLGRGAISDIVFTHVLQDDITEVVLVSTRVLIGPLNGED